MLDSNFACRKVPEVGDIVEYGENCFRTGPETYRVKGWIREAPEIIIDPTDVEGMFLAQLLKEIAEEGGNTKKRMQFCLPEEATHLSLTGICGRVVPVLECKVVGRVNWSEKQIDAERDRALRLGSSHEMIF